ncbi:MAG: hypothetical protein ACXVA9_00720 [Bdellovibrionales bacterium]
MKAALLAVLAIGFMGAAHAEQTASEKASATKNDVKRSAKKTWHKGTELVCAEGDAKCAAEKAKHRTQEGTDYIKDKTKETVDKVD